MAYSKNVRELILHMCQSRSAEGVASLLSDCLEKGADEAFAALAEIAETASVAFTRAELQELQDSVPEPRTIRAWLSKKDAGLPTRSYGLHAASTTLDALRAEARAKCTEGDHTWFDDSRLDGLAYRREPVYELGPLGIEARHSTKICLCCGYSQSELTF